MTRSHYIHLQRAYRGGSDLSYGVLLNARREGHDGVAVRVMISRYWTEKVRPKGDNGMGFRQKFVICDFSFLGIMLDLLIFSCLLIKGGLLKDHSYLFVSIARPPPFTGTSHHPLPFMLSQPPFAPAPPRESRARGPQPQHRPSCPLRADAPRTCRGSS